MPGVLSDRPDVGLVAGSFGVICASYHRSNHMHPLNIFTRYDTTYNVRSATKHASGAHTSSRNQQPAREVMSTSTERARTFMKRLPVFATLAAASVTAAITVGAGSASAADGCLNTTMSQDGHVLTAKVIGGPVSSPVNATGCDIGVYNPDADIAGAEV